MPTRNGRTLAAWITLALVVLGIFAGLTVYAANADFKSDAALQGVQEEKQARLTAERETRAYRQDVNTKLGKILGILERKGEMQ